MIKSDRFDHIFDRLLWEVSLHPQFICSPRGQKVKESLVVSFELTNPRARLLSCPTRKADYGFAVGEFLWYWTGRRDLESLLYYNKRAKDFSNDGLTVNSAYGYRLRERGVFAGVDRHVYGSGATQWETCVKTLEDDPDSRRAVMLINMPEDEREAVFCGSKDVPCTLSLQFFIRDNKLHLHVLMRSNDVMWGLTYDLFSFTLMQECMLLELQQYPKFEKLELGSYYHTAGSMHIYERHFEQAEKIIEEYRSNLKLHEAMEPLSSLYQLKVVSHIAENIRIHGMVPGTLDLSEDMDGTAEWMLSRLVEHRLKRDRQARGEKE